MTTIYINNVAVAGKVGPEPCSFSRQDLWLGYLNIMQKELSSTVTFLWNLSEWRIDNTVIDNQKGWFITK